MNDKKKPPIMASLVVNAMMKTSDGYHEKSEYRSNNPAAKRPAQPHETAASVAEHMTRYAALYANYGAETVIEAVNAACRIYEYKAQNGYETGEEPKLKVLKHLAEELGFDLVPIQRGTGTAWFDASLRRDVEESKRGQDYKLCWDNVWAPICSHLDGTINLDAVQRELSDYHTLLSWLPGVYDHVTGGMATKPFTWPSVIRSLHDKVVSKHCEDAERDAVEGYKAANWKRDDEATYNLLSLVGYEVPIGVIPGWTDEQVKEAEEWAGNVQQRASDNAVRAIQRPDFLAPFEVNGVPFLDDPK